MSRSLIRMCCRLPFHSLLPALLMAHLAAGSAQVAQDRLDRLRLLQNRSWEAIASPLQGNLDIDGRVVEAAWEAAQPITDFYQRERNEGLAATERTEVRALYDPTHLYFAIRCWDSEPEKIRARAIFRDESAGADDLVSIMLDSFNDHRSAIQFVTNANGLIEDLLQTGESTSTRNINWDTVWDSNGRRTDFGWEVEIAIPFHSLRFSISRTRS